MSVVLKRSPEVAYRAWVLSQKKSGSKEWMRYLWD